LGIGIGYCEFPPRKVHHSLAFYANRQKILGKEKQIAQIERAKTPLLGVSFVQRAE
jgi:hypothetical protein